jgi:hypothetical protein
MKKISAIIFAAAMLTAPCFADEGETGSVPAALQAAAPAPASQPARPAAAPDARRTIREAALRTEGTQVAAGKVVSVAPSDLTRPRAALTIADAGGNDIVFEVKALAVIYTRGGELLSLDELQSGQDVEVAYRFLSSGSREATSIKVLN